MKNFYIILFLLSLSSCQNSSDIKFAGYECWNGNDRRFELDRNLYLEEYDKYRGVGERDLPLTKVVRLDSIIAFIGLLTSDKTEELEQSLRKKASDEFSANERKYFYVNHKDENFIQCVYTQKELGYTILITFVLNSEKALQNIRSKGDFIELLNCHD